MPPAESSPLADALPSPNLDLPRLPFDGPSPAADDAVVQVGCASCSGGLLGLPPPDHPNGGGCATCGGGCGSGCAYCYAGRTPCDCCCDPKDRWGHFLCGIYQCICCPDPCYDPHWCALEDASFFQTGGPRPVTQMRLRFDEGFQVPFPDKSEFFFARSDGAATAKGPKQTATAIFGDNDITYREYHYYMEVATGGFGIWIDTPYRNVSADDYQGHAGFSDLSFGTKSLLLDCELFQFTFEFNTFTPTGDVTKGLGTGHVSLEPGLLMALKLCPETYLQAEFAYRFPIGGDPNFEGPVFHYHLSLNQLLCHCGHGVQLVGTAELNGWEFCGGAYTGNGNTTAANVDLGVTGVGNVLNLGPGLRLVICDKIDFGVAGYVNATGADNSIANKFFQFDFRWRF